MTGSAQARSIANLPSTSLENTFNDDELDMSSNFMVGNFDESLSIRPIVSFDVSVDAPPSI